MRRAALMLAVTLSIASAIAMIGQPVADAQQAPDPRIADLVQGRYGSFASPGCATGLRRMSAMPPIAPEWMRWVN
jgi:hypothetical protein